MEVDGVASWMTIVLYTHVVSIGFPSMMIPIKVYLSRFWCSEPESCMLKRETPESFGSGFAHVHEPHKIRTKDVQLLWKVPGLPLEDCHWVGEMGSICGSVVDPPVGPFSRIHPRP